MKYPNSALLFALAASLQTYAFAATTPVCSSPIFSAFQPLATYTAAESYCSSHFPVKPITATSIVFATATATSTALALTTSTSTVVQSLTTSSTTTTTLTSVIASTVTETITAGAEKRAAANNPLASALSQLQSEASAFISTVCSCIEKPSITTIHSTSTKTVTVGATRTSTIIASTTSTSISTVVSTASTSVTVTQTTTSTVSLTPSPTPIACGTFDACDVTHDCASNAADGSECFCYQRIGGGSACTESENCGPTCASDADCSSGELCFTTCCGDTCQPYDNFCANPAATSRLFRARMRRGGDASGGVKVGYKKVPGLNYLVPA